MTTWTRKKYLRLAKGFYGRMKNCLRVMVPKVERALKFAYRDRRVRPRIMRTNNILTLNAAVREHNINYSRMINSLNKSNIQLDRKVLANLAINEPFSFKAVVDELKIQVNQLQKGKIQEKQQGTTYLQALAQGLIIKAPIQLQKEYKQPREINIVGIRGWEKMDEKQRLEAQRK